MNFDQMFQNKLSPETASDSKLMIKAQSETANLLLHVASLSHGFAGAVEKSPEMLGIVAQHKCNMEEAI